MPTSRAPAHSPSAELDFIIGGKAIYYEMNGHWYIVGHDKHGHSTGAVQVS
jgi:hypothetical protein